MTPPPNADDARSETVARTPGGFGPNAWLVDDLYERYLADPASVSQGWREFFSDYRPSARAGSQESPPPAASAAAGAAVASDAAAPSRPTVPTEAPRPTDAVALRGAARRVATNMETSPRRADGDERPHGPGPAPRDQPFGAERAPCARRRARGSPSRTSSASPYSAGSSTCRR